MNDSFSNPYFNALLKCNSFEEEQVFFEKLIKLREHMMLFKGNQLLYKAIVVAAALDIQKSLAIPQTLETSENPSVSEKKEDFVANQSTSSSSFKKIERETRTSITKDVESPVNRDNVEQFVDNLLQDPSVNLQYVPDVLEKRIYVNVITMLLNVLNQVADKSHISFLGHELKLKLEPQKKL